MLMLDVEGSEGEFVYSAGTRRRQQVRDQKQQQRSKEEETQREIGSEALQMLRRRERKGQKMKQKGRGKFEGGDYLSERTLS